MTVSKETAVSLTVSWVPPNAHVLQYRVSYMALTGAGNQDSTVSAVYFLFPLINILRGRLGEDGVAVNRCWSQVA